MFCPRPVDSVPMASRLYSETIVVPFMANFVVFAKRKTDTEAQLRMFCMTDDKMDKTLECQEQFHEVARSRDIEVTLYRCTGYCKYHLIYCFFLFWFSKFTLKFMFFSVLFLSYDLSDDYDTGTTR